MKKITTLIFISILIYSCSKETRDSIECDYMEDRPIDTCMNSLKFNVGSFWVYKDTASLQIDSTYISSINHEWKSYPYSPDCPNDDFLVEEFSISYKSNLRGNLNELIADASIYDPNRYIAKVGMYKKYYCYTATLMDSIIVNNTTYYDINIYNGSDVTYYYKEGIGLIRWVKNNTSQTFDLVNYYAVVYL